MPVSQRRTSLAVTLTHEVLAVDMELLRRLIVGVACLVRSYSISRLVSFSAMYSPGSISKKKLAVASFLVLAVIKTSAAASTMWTWKYTSSEIMANGTFVTVSTPDASGGYLITAITGTRNGQLVNGLQAPGTPIPGNEPFTVDNLVFLDPGPQLTSHGFGFSLSDGTYSNPFFADFLPAPEYLEFFSIPGVGHTELPVTFVATPLTVPEPTPFALIFGALVAVSAVLSKRGLLWFAQR